MTCHKVVELGGGPALPHCPPAPRFVIDSHQLFIVSIREQNAGRASTLQAYQ